MEEVSETPLWNQHQLVRLIQGQQPAGPPAATSGTEHLGSTGSNFFPLGRCTGSPVLGSKDNVWEGVRTCYRKRTRINRHESRAMPPPTRGNISKAPARKVSAGGPFWAGGSPLLLRNGHMAGQIATGMDTSNSKLNSQDSGNVDISPDNCKCFLPGTQGARHGGSRMPSLSS